VTCDVHTQEDRPGRGHSAAMLSFPKPVVYGSVLRGPAAEGCKWESLPLTASLRLALRLLQGPFAPQAVQKPTPEVAPQPLSAKPIF
jgi:hypothetical protein